MRIQKLLLPIVLSIGLLLSAVPAMAQRTVVIQNATQKTVLDPFSGNTSQTFLVDPGVVGHSLSILPASTVSALTVTVTANTDGSSTYGTTVASTTTVGTTISWSGTYRGIKVAVTGYTGSGTVLMTYYGETSVDDAPLGTAALTVAFTSQLGSTLFAAATGRADFYGMSAYNGHSAACYLQFFDLATGSVTLGSTTPAFYLPLPATGGSNVLLPIPLSRFATAMSVASTTTPTGSTTCTTGTVVTFFKK